MEFPRFFCYKILKAKVLTAVPFLMAISFYCVYWSDLRRDFSKRLLGNVQASVFQIYDIDGQPYIRDCISGQSIGSVKIFPTSNISFAQNPSGKSFEDHELRQMSFNQIFQQGLWSMLPRSGPGSRLNATEEAMMTLDSVIDRIKNYTGKNRIQMLDVPCGDMTWMSHFLAQRNDIDYTGYDIVPDIIHSHRKQFVGRGWNFEDRDVIADGFNGIAYDLVFSRMMLQHLYTDDVLKFLNVVSESGSRFFLTTTFPSWPQNSDLGAATGYRFRPLNLEAPPVSLTAPLCYSRDGPTKEDIAYLALWRLPLKQVEFCVNAVRSPVPLLDQKLFFGCSLLSV